MASPRDDCIEKLVKASGGRISREEAAASVDELLARAEGRDAWKDIDGRLAEVASEAIDAVTERAAVLRRNERMDALKAIARHKFYAAAPNPALGLEAKLGGVNTPFAGNRFSVYAQYRALQMKELAGPFVQDLRSADLDKLFASGALEKEWTTELHELNKVRGGRPGITGSAEARKIAEIVQTWQKAAITAINSEGGWIKSYSGYITRTSHDADKIRRAGGLSGTAARDRWVEDILPQLDLERSFHSPDAAHAREVLKEMWPGFVTGDHYDYARPLEDLTAALDIDYARKASAARELHFKSAEDWRAYNRQYGVLTPAAQVMHSLDNAARLVALLREFGSQPLRAFEEDIHYLKARYQQQPEQRLQFDRAERGLRACFDHLTGEANRPVNRTHARLVQGVMAVQRMAKLGLTPFAMLSDLATKAAELRYQGVGFAERFGSAITGYFRGTQGSAKREVAELLYTGVAARIGDIAARFDGGDTPLGLMAKIENTFFRITGITPMTFNQRADAEAIMARHLGMRRGKAFGELGTAEARILKQFDIGEKEWRLLHQAAWHDIDGRTYLTPDIAKNLPDGAVQAYLVETGALHKEASGDFAAHLTAKARADLALKLASYFADRGEYAVLEVGARERAMLYGGAGDWAPGSAKGTAWRLFMQFKQFPAAMIVKSWGREIYGGKGRREMVAGLAEMFVVSTALGIVANALNQLAKGQDPLSRWRNEPVQTFLAGVTRGGAASIYGDFVFGEWSRFGISAAATILGPTWGQIDKFAELWSDLTHMKGARATGLLGLRLTRDNLPFMNMIYTRWAFDNLIYNTIAEWIAPGFLERHERTMKQKAATEYLIKPTQVNRALREAVR